MQIHPASKQLWLLSRISCLSRPCFISPECLTPTGAAARCGYGAATCRGRECRAATGRGRGCRAATGCGRGATNSGSGTTSIVIILSWLYHLGIGIIGFLLLLTHGGNTFFVWDFRYRIPSLCCAWWYFLWRVLPMTFVNVHYQCFFSHHLTGSLNHEWDAM